MGPDTGVGLQKGFQGTADITRFRFVVQDGETTVRQATADDERVDGVAYADLTAAERTRGNSGGKAIPVIMEGAPLVEASEAITVGSPVTTTVNGRARVADPGDNQAGIARQAAGGAGEWIAVQLTPGAGAVAGS